MALLTLGGLELDGFEIPSSVRFGGAQRAAVHKLLGGGRVIDAMGRDDSDLSWDGVFSGHEAGVRARTLDAMRAAGGVLALAWDVFAYDVMITRLEMDFCSPWWIVYKISCAVVSDLAQSPSLPAPNVGDSVLADIGVAAGLLDLGGVLAGASLPGALLAGAGGVAATMAGLSAAQATIRPQVSAAEQDLGGSALAGLVGACGTMAQLCTAQGYVNRALTNLAGVQV